MRCNRRFLLKVKSFVLLTCVLTTLIIVITFVNRRPGALLLLHTAPPFAATDLAGGYKYSAGRRPAAFLAERRPANDTTSYCTFRYELPARFKYTPADVVAPPQLGEKSTHRVLYNILEGNASHQQAQHPVTYATHVTPEFVDYIAELARFWDGAISVAAFVPDDDAEMITRRLVHACACMPEMAKVSVHYVFPLAHPPFVNGEVLTTPSPTCDVGESAEETVTYRTSKQLPYPVNIARNVARQAAGTEFVIVSDVELIPSERLAERFAAMLRRHAAPHSISNPSRVFVVPVFEIEKYEEIPRNKRHLLKLIREEKALYFHRHICSHCQKFPGLENWLQLDDESNDIKPLAVVKREYPYHRWEPIYIGTKDEPLYSETLSWEGKQDKMTQMLEMCLKGYRFVILDNAFLIHWPGVKRKSNEMQMRNKWRYPYLMKNTRQYNNIINSLANRYRRNAKCKVQ